jgi:hypothetical protein
MIYDLHDFSVLELVFELFILVFQKYMINLLNLLDVMYQYFILFIHLQLYYFTNYLTFYK